MKSMVAVGFFLLMNLAVCPSGWAASKTAAVKSGNAAFQKQDFDKAVDQYTDALKADPESPAVNFNLGTGLYKKGDYPAAVTHLNKSLLAEDPVLKEKAQYNLGNALYQSGKKDEDKNIDAAIESMTKSVEHYSESLKLNKDDQDAEHNKEYVQKEIERLKKKKEQQKQQQQNQQNQPQKNSSQDKDKKDSGQNQPGQPQGKKDQSGQQNQNPSSQDQKNQPSNPSPGQPDQKEDGKKDGKPEDSQSPGTKPKSDQQNDGSQKNNDYNQKKPEGQNGQGQPQAGQPENNQTQAEDAGASPDGKQMSKEEAQMLLNAYQENEAPKGLLNLHRNSGDEAPVSKDW